MYTLLNKLFGWDYIVWRNRGETGVARVRSSGTGEPFYFRYHILGIADKISSKNQVIWLTCDPNKYGL